MNTLPDLSQLTHEQLLEFTRQLALQHQSLGKRALNPIPIFNFGRVATGVAVILLFVSLIWGTLGVGNLFSTSLK